MKPNVVVSYNNNVGGVDLKDQSLSAYKVLRKTMKWYLKLYLHAVDIAVHNALVLYNHLHPEKQMRHLHFRLAIVKELIAQHCEMREKSKQSRAHEIIPSDFSRMHCPTDIESKTAAIKWKRCVVCYSQGVRKETKYMCKECDNVPLCAAPCFRNYHAQ